MPEDDAGEEPGGAQGADPGEGQSDQEVAGGEGGSNAGDGGLPFTGLQLALMALTGALLGLSGWAIRFTSYIATEPATPMRKVTAISVTISFS